MTFQRVAVRCESVVKRYGTGEATVTALHGVDGTFTQGQFTAVMGPSGSGKSTLLHCLAGLDTVTAGTVTVGGIPLAGLSRTRLARLRGERIGFVFQAFNLLPTLTVEENILLTARLTGKQPDRDRYRELVAALGLTDRLRHRPSQLSGGQQQRVAVARALVTRPDVVFADEPTGNLDSRSGAEVLRFLRHAVDVEGQAVVMVTHDPHAAAVADRVLFLTDGRIVADLTGPTADAVHAIMRGLGN